MAVPVRRWSVGRSTQRDTHSNNMRAQRASENARLQQASLGPRHANVASKQPVAPRSGDGPQPSRRYARRSPVPERACPTRRRRRVASTHPGAPRRRRSFGWYRTICTACRRSTTSASRASTARGDTCTHEYRLSWCAALIVARAQASGCRYLLTSAHRTHRQLPHLHRRAPVHTTTVPHPLKMSWNSGGPKPA